MQVAGDGGEAGDIHVHRQRTYRNEQAEDDAAQQKRSAVHAPAPPATWPVMPAVAVPTSLAVGRQKGSDPLAAAPAGSACGDDEQAGEREQDRTVRAGRVGAFDAGAVAGEEGFALFLI